MAYLAVAAVVVVLVLFALGIRYHKRRLDRQDRMAQEWAESMARREAWEELYAEAEAQDRAEEADAARKADFTIILDTGTL